MSVIQHPVRVAVLTVAAVISAVLYFRTQEPPTAESRPRLDIGYYVRDARVMGTGPDGRALYRVRASEARQNLADGSVEMEDLAVVYAPAAEVPWRLVAPRGHIPAGGNIIILTGDVVATTETAKPPTRIRTDYLELDPESFVARTARDVTIERARDTLRARGMRIFLKEDRVQLDSQVQGHFQR